SGPCGDASAEVWFTNPAHADTDGDGVSDLEDETPLARPLFATAGVAMVSIIHNKGAGEPPVPAPGEEPTPPAFELRYDDTHLATSPPEGFQGAFANGTVSSS